MRKFTTYLSVSIILMPSCYNVGLLLYWVANHAYIASGLCVKRNEPDNCCQGKCYLNNKLVESSPSSQRQEEKLPTLSLGFELADCTALPILPIFSTDSLAFEAIFPTSTLFYPVGYQGSVFHPPPRA